MTRAFIEISKLLFVFLFICFFQNTAFSKEVTFTVIADAHVKPDKANNSMTHSISNLLKAKDDVNNSGSSFVIFLGDNIDKANKYDLVMFAKIINKFKKPVYVEIGNHDIMKTQDLTKKEYYRLLNKFSKNRISKVPCVKRLNGYTFIFMDGVNEMIPMPRGYYKDKELIWLEKQLKKHINDEVVIIQHFPITDAVKRGTRETFNTEPYFKLLNKYNNVKTIISGHYHSDFEADDENGLKHIGVPSLEVNNEYKVITIITENDKTFIRSKVISVE